MRILVIGNSRAARVFTNRLAKNEDNIVITTAADCENNYIDISPGDVDELKEFAEANELDLTIVCDPELMEKDFVSKFNSANLAVFSPDPEALKIVSSRGYGKKFMYKNKIHTPKFAIFDKAQLAIEYARASNYPLIVRSDESASIWPDVKCNTFAKAVSAIENLFDNCAKKVVLQAFVEGKQFTYYVLTDGYNVMPIDSVATFNGEYAYLDANFIDEDIKKKILKSVFNSAVSALEKYSTGYTGILGIDFVLTDRNELFALEFKSFFNDLDVDLFTESVEEDWGKLLNGAIVGSLLDDYSEIKKSQRCFIAAKSGDDYIVEEGFTLNQAKEKMAEFDGVEGVCNWKF